MNHHLLYTPLMRIRAGIYFQIYSISCMRKPKINIIQMIMSIVAA